MIYDEVLMEQWQHTRITQKQFIHAMRKCGKCGKRALVPIDSTPIESKKNNIPHCTVKVGCLYCAAKGTRKMPKELGEAWILTIHSTTYPQLLEQALAKTTLESS